MENALDFGETVMKTGITRGVNGLEESVSLRLCASASLRDHLIPKPREQDRETRDLFEDRGEEN